MSFCEGMRIVLGAVGEDGLTQFLGIGFKLSYHGFGTRPWQVKQ